MNKKLTKREFSIAGAVIAILMVLTGGGILAKQRAEDNAEFQRSNKIRALESGYKPTVMDADGSPVEEKVEHD